MSDPTPSEHSPERRRRSRLHSCTAMLGWLLLVVVLLVAGLLYANGNLQLKGDGHRLASWVGWRKPSYEARMVLQVLPHQPYRLFPPAPGPSSDNLPLATPQREAVMVKSRLVLNAALKNPKVADLPLIQAQLDPVEWLSSNLRADFKLGPEFLQISLMGDDPEPLSIIVEAVVKAYLDEVVFKEHNLRLAKIDQLMDIARRYEDKLLSKRRQLRELTQAAGASNPKNLALAQQMAMEHLGVAQKELMSLKREMRQGQLELVILEEKEKTLQDQPISPELIEKAWEKDSVVQKRKGEVARLDAQIIELKKASRTPPDPQFLNDLKVAQEALEVRKKEVQAQTTREVRELLLAEVKNTMAGLQKKLSTSAELQQAVTEDRDRYSKLASTINQQAIDLAAMQEEIAQVESIARTAAKAAEEMEVERNSPPRVTRMDDVPAVTKRE